LGRALAIAVCGIIVYLAIAYFGNGGYVTLALAAVVLVYVLDVPQFFFLAFDAARAKVQGVEHDGRHDWYGFKGVTLRVFRGATGEPWVAAKEIARILEIENVAAALSNFGAAEFARQSFAKGEACLSERGLRRLLKYSRHREAGALLLCFEREVLMPLRRRREQSSGST
jgi:hypothetical protein